MCLLGDTWAETAFRTFYKCWELWSYMRQHHNLLLPEYEGARGLRDFFSVPVENFLAGPMAKAKFWVPFPFAGCWINSFQGPWLSCFCDHPRNERWEPSGTTSRPLQKGKELFPMYAQHVLAFTCDKATWRQQGVDPRNLWEWFIAACKCPVTGMDPWGWGRAVLVYIVESCSGTQFGPVCEETWVKSWWQN